MIGRDRGFAFRGCICVLCIHDSSPKLGFLCGLSGLSGRAGGEKNLFCGIR